RPTASLRRRCSMARKRASMREGPLAELFQATEAAQRQADRGRGADIEAEAEMQLPEPRVRQEPIEETVPHVPDFARGAERAAAPPVDKAPEPEPEREEPPARRAFEPVPEPAPRLHQVPRADSGAYLAVIRVVGVGGAGLNAVDRMIDAGISQVEFIAVNTDIQQLQFGDAPVKIHIGRELTEGLGSGADSDVGRRAAEEAYDQIKRGLRGSDMVFVTAGEGGGTGSGAAPVGARIASEL